MLSGWVGGLPVLRDGSEVSYDLSMSSPHSQDSFFGSDSSASWVTTWAKPVILRGSSCSSPVACVGDSISGLSQNLVHKDDIIRDNTCSQMVRESV